MESFIAVNRLWSHNFLDGLRDFYQLEIDPSILNTISEITAEYIRIRYNFVAGFMTALEYNSLSYSLNYRINEIDVEASFVNWFLEGLFREISSALHINPGAVKLVQPIDSGMGVIIGFIVQKTLH